MYKVKKVRIGKMYVQIYSVNANSWKSANTTGHVSFNVELNSRLLYTKIYIFPE